MGQTVDSTTQPTRSPMKPQGSSTLTPLRLLGIAVCLALLTLAIGGACGGEEPPPTFTPTPKPGVSQEPTPQPTPTSLATSIGRTSYIPGIGVKAADEGDGHVSEGTFVEYGSTPPSSGKHWPRWAGCGIYENELPDEYAVHNLEHGQVVMSYNLADEAEVERLVSLAEDLNDFDKWGILRPYSKIEQGMVGLSAWTIVDLFSGVDEKRIADFYYAYRGNRLSPETLAVGRGIPCSASVSR